MTRRLIRLAVWVDCKGCADPWCLRHQMHAFECSCPPVEEWPESPYIPVYQSVASKTQQRAPSKKD